MAKQQTIVSDIRRVMLDKGISQAELGRTLGMSPSQLSSILRDEDYNFTVKMLRRFAAALGTDLEIRIGGSGATTPLAAGGIIGGPITITPSGGTTTISGTFTNVSADLVSLLMGSA